MTIKCYKVSLVNCFQKFPLSAFMVCLLLLCLLNPETGFDHICSILWNLTHRCLNDSQVLCDIYVKLLGENICKLRYPQYAEGGLWGVSLVPNVQSCQLSMIIVYFV